MVATSCMLSDVDRNVMWLMTVQVYNFVVMPKWNNKLFINNIVKINRLHCGLTGDVQIMISGNRLHYRLSSGHTYIYIYIYIHIYI